MRSVVLLSAVCLLGWLAASCETSPKSTTEAATYQCPECRDTVTWVYGTGEAKGIPTGKKHVTHTCTMCKKEWVSGVSTTNACAVCNAEAHNCPTCKLHGG